MTPDTKERTNCEVLSGVGRARPGGRECDVIGALCVTSAATRRSAVTKIQNKGGQGYLRSVGWRNSAGGAQTAMGSPISVREIG